MIFNFILFVDASYKTFAFTNMWTGMAFLTNLTLFAGKSRSLYLDLCLLKVLHLGGYGYVQNNRLGCTKLSDTNAPAYLSGYLGRERMKIDISAQFYITL
jgi:hypothetical protein